MSESEKDYTQEFDDEESQFEDDETSSAIQPSGDDDGDTESGTAVTADPALDTTIEDDESESQDFEPSNGSSITRSSMAPPQSGKSELTTAKVRNLTEQAEAEPSPTSSASFKSNSEIDEIMQKLERLEQAQNLLENFMNSTNEEVAESSANTSVASSVIRSGRSQPAGSNDVSSYSHPFTPGPESNALSQDMDSLRKLLEDDVSGDRSQALSEGQDRSVDELLKEYEILEKEMDQRERPSSRTSTVISSKSISAAKKSPYESGYGVAAASVQMKINEPEPFVVPLPPKPSKSQSQSATYSTKPASDAVKAASSKSESSRTADRNGPLPSVTSGNSKYEERVKPLLENVEQSSKSGSSRDVSKASGDSKSPHRVNIPTTKQVQGIAKDLAATIPPVNNPYLKTVVQKRGSDKDMSKGSGDGDGFSKSSAAYIKHQELNQEIQNLQTENLRQEALLQAYQKENENLFSELRGIKERVKNTEQEHTEEVSRLKTEIATLKLNRLVPASPRFGQKAEVDKLNEELAKKSEQVLELHREVARLKTLAAKSQNVTSNKNANAKKETKPSKAAMMSQEKENEYQRNIRGLQKQVRTLQKILYHKDPGSVPPGFGSKDDLDSTNPNPDPNEQTPLLENRISQLEAELAKSDADAKERLKDFQLRFNGLKTKYEDRIHDLEQKLKEAENANKPPELSVLEDSAFKLEKSQGEIVHLKLEISRYKRELEIAAKSMTTPVSQVTARQDAGTLSLAIKAFKSELADKDKELIRIKKEVVELKKTNANLKREREKYLSSNAMAFSNPNRLPVRAKSETIPAKGSNSNEATKIGGNVQNGRPSTTGTTSLARGSAAYQLLQSTLESERVEYEELLAERNKFIREKEKQVTDLKARLDAAEKETSSSSDAKAGPLVDELRTRLVAQIKVSTALKEHFTKTNAELTNLRKEKEVLEFRVRELTQELNLAKALSRPENEILAGLTEKVEHLNSRYFYREKQLDSLLTRLAASNVSPRLASLDLFSRNMDSTYSIDNNNQFESTTLAGLDLARLSPTTLDLLGHASDLFTE